LLLMALNVINRATIKKNCDKLPMVSIILTVYNEEKVIKQRIGNLLELDYPRHLLQIIVASDGSDDETNNIASKYLDDNLILYARLEKKGKSQTQNDAVKLAQGEIIIFTDADTIFQPDFVRKVVRSFADPKVGCVTGECVYFKQLDSITTESLSFYWRYELLLRRLESNSGLLFTVSGACMAVRKGLFKPITAEYGEDCVVPLDVLIQGFRVVVDHEARAHLSNVPSPAAEYRARSRMTLRNFTGTMSRSILLDPLKFPMLSLAIISHKFLRWFTPFFLVAIFFLNFYLLFHYYYFGFFIMQMAFYSLAILGLFPHYNMLKYKIISWPFSFCVGNIGIMVGVLKALFGKKVITYRNV